MKPPLFLRNINRKRLESAFGLFTSAVLFSLVGFLAKMSRPILTTWQISFGRAVFGAVAMVLIHAVWKVPIDGPNRALLILRGISGTLSFVALIAAMQLMPLGIAMVLFFLFPVFASLFSPWINREPVSLKQWVYILISLGGAFLILGPDAVAFKLSRGYLWGFSSALFAGLNINFVRRLSGEHSTFCIYFYWSLVAAIVSFLPAFEQSTVSMFSGDVFIFISTIGLLATIAQLCLNYGFVYLNASEGSLILMGQVPIATILGAVFFHEKIGWLFAFGAFFILLGAIGLSKHHEDRNSVAYPKSV